MFFVRLVRGRVVGSQISVNNVEQVIFNRLGAINIFDYLLAFQIQALLDAPVR